MKFYYAPQSRAVTVHWMLEELGVPYDLEIIDFRSGKNMEPSYLAVNPMGKVPALEHKGHVITESAAICTYLADEFADQKLNVPIGDSMRGNYLRWLFFAPSCIEPAIVDILNKRPEANPGSLGYGTLERVLNMLTKQLEKTPYIACDRFTAADVVVGATVLWGQMASALPRDNPTIQAYCERLGQRPLYGAIWQKSNEMAAELAARA